ncbi:hypothetical protein LTR17_013070 [Elasticomyces elasticus]|nr:hypothetical protein LTR17_013070 [Elasticomyces elasticus]
MLASRPAARYICAQCRAFSTTRRSLAEAAEVKRLGVVGAGQMGLGIALVASRMARVPVVVVDNSQKSLDKGLAFADKLLAKDVGKGKLSQSDADKSRSRLTTTTSMDPLSEVDMVIEAVPEIVDLKKSIFAQLAQICPQHAILATNTSSISITQIARATTSDPTDLSAASRVISTHFMNPVPVQKGVEIISGLQTSTSTLATAIAFCKAMGKIPSVSADSPGFLANRILMPYINEAIICLETGVGGEEDIDGIMKNGTGVPMGPLALADFIGLDTCLSIMEVLHQGLGDSFPQIETINAPPVLTRSLAWNMATSNDATVVFESDAIQQEIESIPAIAGDGDGSPAANAVLYTAELLEMILIRVNAKTLLFSQKVCSTWRQAITRSQSIRKKLFLLPATFEEALYYAAVRVSFRSCRAAPSMKTAHITLDFGKLGDQPESEESSRLGMQLMQPPQELGPMRLSTSLGYYPGMLHVAEEECLGDFMEHANSCFRDKLFRNPQWTDATLLVEICPADSHLRTIAGYLGHDEKCDVEEKELARKLKELEMSRV